MQLKAKVEKLADIPEALRDHYSKEGDDEPWILQVQAVDGLELGDINAVKADADRCFAKLADRIRGDLIGEALRLAGGDRTLLEPHVTCRIDVDRQTFATRVIGADGKFTSLQALLDDLRAKPGFEAAFDDVEKVTSSPLTPAAPINLTEKMRSIRAQRAAEKPSLPDGNPWLRNSFNLTNQMIVTRADPSRAAVMRAEAEGSR